MAIENINIRVNGTSNMGQVVSQLKAASAAANSLNASVAGMQNAWAKTGNVTSTDLGIAQSAIGNYRNEMRAAAELSGEWNTATKNLTASTTAFNEALAKNKVRLRDVRGRDNRNTIRAAMREQIALNNMVVKGFSQDATGKISADIYTPKPEALRGIKYFRQEMGYMNNILRSVSEQTLNWGKNTQWAGRQLTVGFSVPISMAITALSYFGFQLDQQMVRITKVYGDATSAYQVTDESIRNMASGTAKFVAEQYGIMGKETRDVMGELAATGREGAELQQTTAEVMRASLLGDMDTDTSLRLLRVLSEAYRLTGDELRHYVNYFNEIENSTALTMNDIAEGLPRIAGIMQATGVSLEDTVVLLTAFKEAGIDVAEGANALKSINFKAIAASPTAKNNFFRITGQDMGELVNKTNGEFLPMMQEIASAMEELDQPQRTDLIARVFGIHQGSRALTIIEQLTNGSKGMLRATEVSKKSASELAESAAAEQKKIMSSASQQLKSMFAVAVTDLEVIGANVLKVITPIVGKIMELFSWFSKLSPSAQEFATKVALVTAAAGPLIMIVGQFGNLFGNIGKFAAVLGGLTGRFQILNPMTKAAEVLQKKLNAEQYQAANATDAHRIAMERLTLAMEQQAAVASAAIDARTNAAWSGAPVSTGSYDDYLGMPVNRAPTKGGQGQFRSASGKFAGAVPVGLSISDPGLQMHIPDAEVEKTKTVRENFGETFESSKKLEKSWEKNARSLAAMGGASMLVGQAFGSELLTNVGMFSMLIGAVGPGLGQIATKMAGVSQGLRAGIDNTSQLGAMVLTTGSKWDTMKAKGVGAMSSIRTAGTVAIGAIARGFGAFLGFLAGPWGLAIGAAGLLLAKLWGDNKKAAEESQAAWDNMANNAKALGEQYGFMDTSPLELARANPDWDESSFDAQVLRIKELKHEESEYYKNVMAFKKEVDAINDESLRKEVALEGAISQGRQALIRGVSPEEAQQIAQDAYALITGELMSMGEFQGEYDIKAVLSDTATSGTEAAKNFTTSFNEGIGDALMIRVYDNVDLNISDEQRKMWESEIGGALEAMSVTTDFTLKEDILEELMGGGLEEFDEVGRQFRYALDEGMIRDDSTIMDFLSNYGGLAARAAQEGLFWEPIDNESIARLQMVTPLLNEQIDLTRELKDEESEARDLSDLVLRRRENYLDRISQKEQDAIKKQAQGMTDNSRDANRVYTNLINQKIEELRNIDRSNAALRQGTNILFDVLGIQRQITDEKENTAAEDARAARIMEANRAAAKAAQEEMLEYRRAGVNAWRSAWDASVDEFISDAMSEMDDQHRAEVDARRAQGDAVIKGIEADFDQREKVADAAHRRRMESLEAAQEREEKALDARQKSLRDAWEARRDAEKERQSQEKENFDRRWDGIEEREEKAQENRRDAIERTYDDRIQKVQDLIEAEEAAERRRQQIFDKEKQRIQRMAQMYSSGIDINMAINSGDLDEAARITNDMSATRQGWAIDDAAENAATEAEKRRKAMGSQIEIIEGEKEARLKALDEVEKAEDEARKRRQEAARKAMEERFKLIDKEIEREKEKNDAIIADERELLRKRYEAREKNLNDSFAKEKELRQIARDTSISIEQEKTDGAIVQIERHNAADKKAVEKRLEILRDHTPMTEQEYQTLTDNIVGVFNSKNIKVKASSKAATNEMAEYNVKKVRSELNEFMDDKVWEKAGEKITDAMIEGGLGFNMSPAEFRKFILEGELPKRLKKKQDNVTFGPNKPIAMHTGGIIGQDAGGRTGYSGNNLSQSETMVNMLRGEGVLNLRAMSQPGMKEFVRSANQNRTPFTGDSEIGMGGVFSGLMAGAVSARMSSLATMSGLEHGLSQAQSNMGVGIGSVGSTDMSGTTLNSTQLANARIIMDVGRSMGATQRDLVIGLMTAMQESTLLNRDHGDRDSVGLFQQRTSQGWGSIEQIMDPQYSSRKFFTELLKDGRRHEKPLWQAADDVQRSAYPTYYAKWEGLARALVGGGANAGMGRSLAERWKSIIEQMDQVRAHSDLGLADLGPARGRMSGPGMGWKKQWAVVSSRFPDAYLSSSYRPGAVTSSGWPSYHGEARAVDLVATPERMMAMFDFLRSKYGNSIHELYYSPAGHRQVRQGKPHYPTGITRAQHFDHVHWAMKNGGWVPGQGYGDVTPAMLEPKEFVVNRKAAENHPHLLGAMNAGQQFAIPDTRGGSAQSDSRFDNQGNTEYNVNINLHGNINKEIDFERATLRALEKLDRKRGGTRRITK